MKKIISLVLLLCLSFSMCITADAATKSTLKTTYKQTGKYLEKKIADPTGADWVIYGMSVGKYPIKKALVKKYEQSVIDELNEKQGILSKNQYTEYSKVIIALSALGKDARSIAGYDLVSRLEEYDKVVSQGIIGPVWALVAINSGEYNVSSELEQKYVQAILDSEIPGGGFNFAYSSENSKVAPDVDMTAMVLRALAPYKKQAEVKAVKERAIKILSKAQKKDGTFASCGVANCESCAQVICGLKAWGIDANKNKNFVKKSKGKKGKVVKKSAVDGMMSFYDKKKHAFRHVNKKINGYKPTVNAMATEQAFYALGLYLKK